MTNKKQTVLLVDDDADDRYDFGEALKEIDETIECIFAKDGKQAMQFLNTMEGELPRFVFLDLRLPRITGKQCLLQLKADDRFKNIPVIIYTTSKDEEEAHELQQSGAVHFISKPDNPEEIYYLLSLVLEERWDDVDKL